MNSGKRKRAFTIILYPDSTTYDCESVLNYISLNYADFAYILHDRDILTADIVDTETGEIKAKKGDIKKPHYHVIFKFKDNRTVSAVAKELNLAEHDIEIIKSWKAQVRYLIHLDDEDKVKYDTKDIVANTPIEKYLFLEKEECESALEILEEILDKDIRDPFTLMKFVCSRPDLYAAYRRNGASFMECMKYNSKAFRENMEDIKRKIRKEDLAADAYEKGKSFYPGFTPFTALKKDDPALHAFDDEDEIDF